MFGKRNRIGANTSLNTILKVDIILVKRPSRFSFSPINSPYLCLFKAGHLELEDPYVCGSDRLLLTSG